MGKIVNKNAKFRQLLAFTIDIHSTIHLTYAANKKIKFMFCTDKKMVSILITSFSILRDDDDNETDFSSNV